MTNSCGSFEEIITSLFSDAESDALVLTKPRLHPHRVSGDPPVLVRLIHDGLLRLDKVEDHNEDELKAILERCGIKVSAGCTKVCGLNKPFFFVRYLNIRNVFTPA